MFNKEDKEKLIKEYEIDTLEKQLFFINTMDNALLIRINSGRPIVKEDIKPLIVTAVEDCRNHFETGLDDAWDEYQLVKNWERSNEEQKIDMFSLCLDVLLPIFGKLLVSTASNVIVGVLKKANPGKLEKLTNELITEGFDSTQITSNLMADYLVKKHDDFIKPIKDVGEKITKERLEDGSVKPEEFKINNFKIKLRDEKIIQFNSTRDDLRSGYEIVYDVIDIWQHLHTFNREILTPEYYKAEVAKTFNRFREQVLKINYRCSYENVIFFGMHVRFHEIYFLGHYNNKLALFFIRKSHLISSVITGQKITEQQQILEVVESEKYDKLVLEEFIDDDMKGLAIHMHKLIFGDATLPPFPSFPSLTPISFLDYRKELDTNNFSLR